MWQVITHLELGYLGFSAVTPLIQALAKYLNFKLHCCFKPSNQSR